jgi:hypothetical protein
MEFALFVCPATYVKPLRGISPSLQATPFVNGDGKSLLTTKRLDEEGAPSTPMKFTSGNVSSTAKATKGIHAITSSRFMAITFLSSL